MPYIHKAVSFARGIIQRRVSLLTNPKQQGRYHIIIIIIIIVIITTPLLTPPHACPLEQDHTSLDLYHDHDHDHINDDLQDTETTTANTPSVPLICLEIGSYCGYSAVAIASQLAPGGMLYCLELHPKCVAWTTRMVALAGLSARVKVIQGG